MRIRGWGASDVGRRRDHNEDRFLCNDALGLYAVADGMGGHLGGERASRMAVELLEREMGVRLGETLPVAPVAKGEPAPHPIAVAMRDATQLAARSIWETAQQDAELTGMG